MTGKPVSGLLRAAPILATLALSQCRREAPPALPAPPATSEAAPLEPWSWHFVGGLVVITGEMADPAEVTLRGTTLNETRTLSYGPVRWELLRPPSGEVADLKTGDGKLLMHFDFSKDPPPRERPSQPLVEAVAAPTRPQPPPAPDRPAPAPAVAPPAPVQVRPPAQAPAPAVPGRPLLQPTPPAGASPSSPARPDTRATAVPPRPSPQAQAPSLPPQGAAPRSQGMVPPRPQPVPTAPTLGPSGPVRVAPTGPARPGAVPVPPPQPVPAPRPSAPPPQVPAHPTPTPVAPPNPKVPPRAPRTPIPPPSTGGLDWPGAGEGLNLLRGPKGEKRICMTFDGGSTAEVATEVLDALRSRNIRTTIFLTGEFVRKYPDLVRRMDREGHELGNHTLDHPHFAPGMRRDPAWTKERFQQELLEADRILMRLLGHPFEAYWRAPYGEQTPEIRKWAEELGYRHVGWSEGADTLDWATVKERKLYRTGDAILDKLRTRMEKQDGDGLIVLMHLGSGRPEGDRPGQVLGPFLDRALRDGWHFVAIGDYLKGLGKPRWEPVRRAGLLR